MILIFLKLIAYQQRLNGNHFVVDSSGRPPTNSQDATEYANLFSPYDIFQGALGDCFMIATLLSFVKNRDAILRVIPIDNAYKENMRIGAYHFRLWKVGDWYDVVIDDQLIVTNQLNLCFCQNHNFRNEFWIGLLEKAVAKYFVIYIATEAFI